jgi:hypothetical protein
MRPEAIQTLLGRKIRTLGGTNEEGKVSIFTCPAISAPQELERKNSYAFFSVPHTRLDRARCCSVTLVEDKKGIRLIFVSRWWSGKL